MRCGILLIVIALFTPIFYGCGSNPTGGYYPPQTVVNTIGIKKVPLAAAGITDYKMFFSFEKEPEQERIYKTLYKGKKILNLSPGYFTEADYLGRKYYLYDDSDSLKITAADSKQTVAQFIPPRRIMQIAAFQQRLKGKDFLVVQLEQFTMSNSSTLLIFDDKFQIVYQDHLLGAIEIGHAGDKIVVKSENLWYPEGEEVTVNGDWIYHLPSENKNISRAPCG